MCQAPFDTIQESDSHRASEWLDKPIDHTRLGQPLTSWLGGHIRLLIAIMVLSFVVWFLIARYHAFGPSTPLIILLAGLAFLASDFIPITKIHLEKVMTIRAPMEKVYGLDADYRKWTEYDPRIKSVRLLNEQGNVQTLEVNFKNGGKFQETQQTFNDKVEYAINMMRMKLREVHYYEAAAEGTQVTVKADLTYRGIWGRLKLAKRVEEEMQTVLTAQKRMAELS